MGAYKLLLGLIVFIIFLQGVTAESVVINSNDWRDVYSGALYAKLNDDNFNFVYQKTQAVTLLNNIAPSGEFLLIESVNNPVTTNYASSLRTDERSVRTFKSSNPLDTNLDLANELVDIKSYIILDDTFGYSAMAVASYAVRSKSYVLFVNKQNVEDVQNFLENVDPDSVLLYGKVDREVKEAMAGFNPEVINTGNKFENNIEIIRKFFDIEKSKQIILANGEVIESQLLSGAYPALLIGTSVVPDSVIDFLANSDSLEVAVVVGYDLLENAKKIRQETGLKVLVKFAQGQNSQFIALDMFPLPKFEPKVRIESVEYNMLTGQLEVVYTSNGTVAAYTRAISHIIMLGDEEVGQVGDDEPFFIDAKESKTITYDLDLTRYDGEDLAVDSNVVYGDSPDTMEKVLVQLNGLEFIKVEDDSEIDILDVIYNPQIERFEITISNLGEETVFVRPTIVDLLIDDELYSFSGDQIEISPGSDSIVKIKAELEEVDYEDNPFVNLEVRYGSREKALVNFIEERFEFKTVKKFNTTLIVIVVLLVIIALLLISRKKQ